MGTLPQLIGNAVVVLILAVAGRAWAAGLTAQSPRCEYLVDPIGIDEPTPRLSWTVAAQERNAFQSAYQVIVASTEKQLDAGHGDVWDSGKVLTDQTAQVEYGGPPLASRQICYWRVRAWDQAGQPGPWTATAKWEMGLLKPEDWHAKWIEAKAPARPFKTLDVISASYETTDGKVKKDVTEVVKQMVKDASLELLVKNDLFGGDPAKNKHKQLKLTYSTGGEPIEITAREDTTLELPPRPVATVGQSFTVDGPIAKARLYVTALGIYEVKLNDQKVGDAVLAPDWTDYKKRVRYQVYDVTKQVKTGQNGISAMVANGWYAGHIGNGGFHFWGTQPSVVAQLELTHDDGSVQTISTDQNWKATASQILKSDFMLGEEFDAREVPTGSVGVTEREAPPIPVQGQVDQPVRELMTMPAKSVDEPAKGHWVYDIGQNMVGVARIKISAPAGTTVTIRFAEMLNPDKSIYTANYRGAPSIDKYTCRGGGVEVWQPTFTFHGFRYVELTGLPAAPGLDAVTGVVIGSDTPDAGSFTCSDPRINQLQSNIRWGQRGNFVSVPTDCPQRDERLGWMGDAQVFVGTAVYNADVAAFFDKWMVDVDDAQTTDGRFSNVSPDNNAGSGTPGWGDAGVVVPYTVYRAYGDKRELKRHLPNMIRWVEWCRDNSDGLIRTKKHLGSNFGDWLNIKAKTPDELMGTAYFAYSTKLVAASAAAVGDEPNARKYAELFDQIKAAFVDKYVDKQGNITGGTQTSFDLALTFGLLPDDLRPAATDKLVADIHEKGDHLSTGFLGVSYLLPTLTNNGHADTAFTLLTQDTFPSWLFSVKHGATTIWERWDGWTPEKGFQDPGMNSFNHYSLGSCGQWLYSEVAGIGQAPDSDSFKHIVIHPHVGGGLTSASATYDSIRGRIESSWKVDGGKFTLTVTIPANTKATVHVPTSDPGGVTESGKPIKGVTDGEGSVFEIGSGSYVFIAAAPK